MELIAWAISKGSFMELFRYLLKSESEIYWSQDLQITFNKVKEDIVRLVSEEVNIFFLGAWHCLVADCSRVGSVFCHWQKRCKFPEIHPPREMSYQVVN